MRRRQHHCRRRAGGGKAYPTQLGKILGTSGKSTTSASAARTLLNGGDKPYQKQAAFQAALAYKPDVVVIMLGTNDTKPQNWSSKTSLPPTTRT